MSVDNKNIADEQIGVKHIRTAIFGGTFDPPHRAHLAIAEAALNSERVDEVIFVPAVLPPHKTTVQITPYHHRFAMLTLLVAADRRLSVSDIESRRKGPSYTFDTITELKSAQPEKKFFLLIGGDSLVQLHSWYRARELVNICDILTYPRPNTIISRQELEKFWDSAIVDNFLENIIDTELLAISSTEIRDKIKKKENITRLLPESIVDYLHKHCCLYQNDKRS